MRKLTLLAAIGLFSAVTVTTAFGCGDKLLSLGRGVRFQRANLAARPASVLVYASPKSSLGSTQLQSTLKQAGHKLQTAGDAATLEQDLKSTKFDLVLVEYGDTAALAECVKGASANMVVVPVMNKAQKTEYAAASKQFAYIVKSSGDPTEYLLTIDQAMKSRPGARS